MSVDEGIQLLKNVTSAINYTFPDDLVLVANMIKSIVKRTEGKVSRNFSQVYIL